MEASLAAPTKTKEPPLENFPIPAELREDIYELLLSSVLVRSGTSCHFHTNILGVNKIIKEEAEAWLHKHHTFVLVSFQWSDSTVYPPLIELIPKVTEDEHKVRAFKDHSMHIHLSRGLSKQDDRMGWFSEQEPELHQFVMLGEDLDILAATFQILLQRTQGQAVLIRRDPGNHRL